MPTSDDLVILFVHGFAGSAHDWDAVIAELHGTATPAAISLPGHDGTPAPSEFRIETMAALVNDTRRKLGGRHLLVGHSLGVRVILEAASRQTHRLAGLVAIDNSVVGNRQAEGMLETMRATPDKGRDRILKASFAEMFCGNPMAEYRHTALGRLAALDKNVLLQMSEALLTQDSARVTSQLKAIQAPLLVLQSTTKDHGPARRSIAPHEETRWTKLVKAHAGGKASVVNLTELGHFAHVEAPHRVARHIREFAQSLDLSAA